MKDNISIIFAAIIGVILIVILPLFSILDRQDSMAYNVVLTQTTKFVDNIRNNGFIDRDSYNNYISALASTANTYKVELEVYKKRLIPDVESGKDVYIEDVELFNTMDVLEVIESEESIENSNEKNNVYLLKENDEVYIKVYNTNMTTGSILYNFFAGTYIDKVIDISYGGIVNNVNWELFDKINASAIDIPEVLMEVPVNAKNKTNIMKITDNDELEPVDCQMYPEYCEDGVSGSQAEQYTYLYDLTYPENKTINIAVELKNMDYIAIGENKLASLDEMTEEKFNKAKDYIIANFIQLNEMIADVDLKYRGKDGYYMFNIILTNVEIFSVDLLSTFASVSILPGLGQDLDGTLSIGAESVRIELVDELSVHTVTISEPIHWNKFLETGSLSDSLMTSKEVYVDLDIAFIISYTGIDEKLDVKSAVENNLSIEAALTDGIEIFTASELKTKYKVDLNTRTAGHVLVKFKYKSENLDSTANYISLSPGWITTDIIGDDDYRYDGFDYTTKYAYGAESSRYRVIVDNSEPVAPKISLDGIRVNDDALWYIRQNVLLSVNESVLDTIMIGNKSTVGGSGVARNTLTLTGATQLGETENTDYIIQNEGTTYAVAKAYDYLGNVVSTKQTAIRLDKTPPTTPVVTITGTKGEQGWYKSNVTLTVSPGSDAGSGVAKTTYQISGVQTVTERELPQSKSVVLTENGFNRVIITTYDVAGNYTQKTVDVKIDKTTPLGVELKIISGSKNTNGWYNTDVTVQIEGQSNNSPSGIAKREYQLIGTDGGANISKTKFDGNQEVTVTQSGKYTLKAFTYNVAGNVQVQQITFNIDKDAPNKPTVNVTSEKPIYNGWYSNNITVTLNSNKDVGPSTEQSFSYVSTIAGTSSKRTETTPPKVININNDGIYTYDVYSVDYASNESHVQSEVKVDKTPPNSADFVITGTKGLDNWYVSDVDISYTGGSDATSGIKSIVLSQMRLTTNTPGTEVIMTTEDNAGNKVQKYTTIKLDKISPTAPIVNLPTVTGYGITGVNMYNKNVDITITPGSDEYIDRTTCKVLNTQTNKEIISENNNLELSLNENGKYEVITYAYDKAGNKTTASKVIWINKDKPLRPKIASIDGQQITNNATQTVTGNNSRLNIEVVDVEIGSTLKVVVVKSETYEKKEATIQVTKEKELVSILLEEKGTYTITATQTNMYGTGSDISVGNYNYKYE